MSQPKLTQLTIWLNYIIVFSPTHTQTYRELPGNPGSWFSVCNLILIQLDELWKTTSIFFVNGRWPQFFPNGRWPQFCSRRPRELVFGMQPYFNPTRWIMEDDLNFFWKFKMTYIFLKWKITSKKNKKNNATWNISN